MKIGTLLTLFFYLITFFSSAQGISDKVNKNLKIFEKKEKELKDEENEIVNQKNILSKEELDNKVVKFRKEVQNFRNKKKEFDNEIKKERVSKTRIKRSST